ncbi:MAG: thioredoxin domain-containing protein [Candidatus Omnitrophica bacterium]|nr:thioredoxin domain-containing protein [Candidatus Omnitrophota bacterium]
MRKNRLAKEKSPYLLQHAENPVDWYPWGAEAFEKAKKEDKPMFLSIGYSTCHWCHVMEHESFENEDIAKVMNENYVSIKVDREERPDVDQIYMQAVMALTGSGGWPLSVFITPELKPFYGGTYFPPDDRWGRPGFKSLLLSVAEAWKSKRQDVISTAADLTEVLRNIRKDRPQGELDQLVLKKAFEQLQMNFDARSGGFGSAPKFPRSHLLSLLFRYWKRTKDNVGAVHEPPLQMAEQTLVEMAKGGMYDQIGGGFHRYSTDANWRIPHFEKMLYDQALLARTYLEAYQITKKETYAAVAREIFEYVLRDLTHPEGGFYSAEDADSLPPGGTEKREGAFYLWSESELKELLEADSAKAIIYQFGAEPAGNARSDPQGEFKGLNTLYQAHSIEETARYLNWSVEKTKNTLERSKKKLFETRLKRPRPHLDDKVLVDWNGLMISSFAFGARVLNDDRYRQAAERAADFILSHLVAKNERLLHRFRDGEAGIDGKLEDYAFFVNGLLELYEATFDMKYLREAKRLTDITIDLFWDAESAGFYMTPKDGEALITRPKELYDGAIPSGNSFALLNLLRLGRLTMNEAYEKYAENMIKAFSAEVESAPTAYPQFLSAFDFAMGPSKEIVIAGGTDATGAIEMINEVFSRFIPNKVVAFRPPSESAVRDIAELIPFIEDQRPLDGKATAYVCENYICKLPTTDMEQFEALLDGK